MQESVAFNFLDLPINNNNQIYGVSQIRVWEPSALHEAHARFWDSRFYNGVGYNQLRYMRIPQLATGSHRDQYIN